MSPAGPGPDERLTWLVHGGQRVLKVDLRGLDREGILVTAERYGTTLRGQPPDSVLLLVLHGSAEFHPEAMTRARSVMMEVSAAIRRSAVVGPEGMMKQAINGFFEAASLMGHDLRQRGRGYPEEAEGNALDWLIER
jgi:hypothetical protein